MAAAPPRAEHVLLEDSWEAEDVIEECRRLNIPCTELPEDELRKYEAENFVSNHTFMCNTELAQEKLKQYFGCEDLEAVGCVPCTYPAEFLGSERQYFFGRDIQRRKLGEVVADLEASSFADPLFIKPESNNKAFDGKVIKDKEDLESIVNEVQSMRELVDAFPVFTSPPVRFRIEYRLFIGGGRLYCNPDPEQSWFMIRAEPGLDKLFEDKGAAACPKPDQSFVDAVLAKVGAGRYWVVDIGLIAAEKSDAKVGERIGEQAAEGAGKDAQAGERWVIVEVNPPFSVDDHGLQIEPYCRYYFEACAWIRAMKK